MKLTFKPTSNITINDPNFEYNSSFGKYIDSILNYWNKNYSNDKLQIQNVSKDSKQVRFIGDQNKITTSLSTAKNDGSITYKNSADNFDITWVKPEQSNNTNNTDEIDYEYYGNESEQQAAEILKGALQPLIGSSGISSRISSAVNKPISEEINRIKQLMK